MTTLITGNTYPVREEIKSLGGRWDAVEKGWRVPNEKAKEAQNLVNGAPKKKSSGACNRPTVCVVCGAKQTVDRKGYYSVKIYRSGECSDCYEERKMGY